MVKNLQAEYSSTEAFLINLSLSAIAAGGPLMTRLRMTKLDYESRIDYECHSLEDEIWVHAGQLYDPDHYSIDP